MTASASKAAATSLVVAVVLILPGCGSKAPSTEVQQPEALSPAAAQFYTVFFNRHQRGTMDSESWARLRRVTTPVIYDQLRGRYAGIARDSRAKCQVLLSKPRRAAAGREIVAAQGDCPGGPVGYGVTFCISNGAWRVCDLADVRSVSERRAAVGSG